MSEQTIPESVQFIIDAEGRKTAVILPIEEYKPYWIRELAALQHPCEFKKDGDSGRAVIRAGHWQIGCGGIPIGERTSIVVRAEKDGRF